MNFNEGILKYEEKAVFALRELYCNYGYKPFKMSKFEEYDLYSENKDFLVSDGVITFNDTDGKLLALKPDVTLSIIKNSKDNSETVERFYYNENVYRISDSSHTYKEIMQTGLECIGNITDENVTEVSLLAAKSLSAISDDFVLHISNVALLNALAEEYSVSEDAKKQILTAITDKNADLLRKNCTDNQYNTFITLIKSFDSFEAAISELYKVADTDNSKKAVKELDNICTYLKAEGFGGNINIDFSIISATGYYSGIVFKGFVNGISQRVLSGGQYDKLMKRMHRKAGAIGFAVYLDTLSRHEESNISEYEKSVINIALPKGRLGERVYAMFEKAGFECPEIKETNRKLIFENKDLALRFFWVKPSDVAIYVERGAADIGVAGKDILLEYSPDVYELLDLNIGKCRMAVAAKSDFL